MELRITGRHAKLRPNVREYAEEKLGPVSRYDAQTRLLEVVLDHEAHATTVEAKAHVGKGAPLVVRSRHATPEGAIDLVHDKIESALRKRKERIRDRKRVERPEGGAAPVPGGGEEE